MVKSRWREERVPPRFRAMHFREVYERQAAIGDEIFDFLLNYNNTLSKKKKKLTTTGMFGSVIISDSKQVGQENSGSK